MIDDRARRMIEAWNDAFFGKVRLNKKLIEGGYLAKPQIHHIDMGTKVPYKHCVACEFEESKNQVFKKEEVEACKNPPVDTSGWETISVGGEEIKVKRAKNRKDGVKFKVDITSLESFDRLAQKFDVKRKEAQRPEPLIIQNDDYQQINISMVDKPVDDRCKFSITSDSVDHTKVSAHLHPMNDLVNPKDQQPRKPGATCAKCHRDYPYADNVPGFICWGCKNGY